MDLGVVVGDEPDGVDHDVHGVGLGVARGDLVHRREEVAPVLEGLAAFLDGPLAVERGLEGQFDGFFGRLLLGDVAGRRAEPQHLVVRPSRVDRLLGEADAPVTDAGQAPRAHEVLHRLAPPSAEAAPPMVTFVAEHHRPFHQTPRPTAERFDDEVVTARPRSRLVRRRRRRRRARSSR